MIYGAALVIAALYCWGVATTKPFTTAADAIVALGYLVMGLVLVGCLRRRSKGARPAGVDRARLGGRRTGNLAPWVVAIVTLAIVELAAYFAGWGAGRHAFPTLSSLYDEASGSSVAAKAVLVFVWLAVGWGLFGPRPKPLESEP